MRAREFLLPLLVGVGMVSIVGPVAAQRPLLPPATAVARMNADLTRLKKPFVATKTFGELSDEEKVRKLLAAGDSADAAWFSSVTRAPRDPKPYEYKNHEIGFAPVSPAGTNVVSMISATAVTADRSLVNQQVDISIDYVRIVDYPGKHAHRVLMDFASTNRFATGSEDAHYQRTFDANDGDAVGLRSLPIFNGLGVGAVGLAFQCRTVNVENPDDKGFLNVLQSDVGRQGLELLKTAQPAIKPFTDIAIGVTKMISTRNDNIKVQDIDMGLLLSNAPAQAKLAQGSYFVVQAPVGAIIWTDWQYDIPNGLIKRKSNGDLLPYNYFVFSVTKH